MDTKDFLQGDEWLGHPLHPALVALPIGAWIFSLVMDGVAAATGNKCAQEAADASINIGLAGAGASAVTGLSEFLRTIDDKKALDAATDHGLCNVAITSTYAVNAIMRASRRRQGKPVGFLPRLMSAICVASVGYTGWLGGELVYKHGVGVHEAEEKQKQLQRGTQKKLEKATRAHM